MVLLLAAFLGWKEYEQRQERAAYLATLTNTAAPNVMTLPDTILVDYLGKKRTLYVLLPEGYWERDSLRYPVLYFFDGEALFNELENKGTEWEVDEVINRVAGRGGPAAIVIGIADSNERLTEYKPFPSPDYPDKVPVTGAEHLDWVVNGLKPWVDANFRTLTDREHTGLGGCSLGGLMAYYGVMTYPEVFSRGLIFSPSLWVNEKVFTLHESVDLTQMRLYFCAGEEESSSVNDNRKMMTVLRGAGLPDSLLMSDVFPGKGHGHDTWQLAFASAYPWIME